MRKKYYVLCDGVDPDEWFWAEAPCCIDKWELDRLVNDFSYGKPRGTKAELRREWREATDEDIAEFGVYDTPAASKLPPVDQTSHNELTEPQIYNGYAIQLTNYVKNAKEPFVYLYEIVGLKDAGRRPFLTTIEQCMEYIRLHTEKN